LRERAAENRMPDIPRPTRESVPKHELPREGEGDFPRTIPKPVRRVT
jgi:hypothetical protein